MKRWSPKELEEVVCDFCGSSEASWEFTRADGMRVIECANCGLAYLNPRPRPEVIPEFYNEDYFTGVSAAKGEGGLKLKLKLDNRIIHDNQSNIPRALTIIKKKFGDLKGKSILEIGCAVGDLLIQLKKEGAFAKGIDISVYAADIARRRGLDVFTGTIEEYIKQCYTVFDIIIALEVIEHVLSPTLFLKNCAKIIKPGGLLVLSTPNYSCAKRFREKWHGFNTSFEHLYFFHLEVLKKMCLENKLVLKYWETSKYSGRHNNNFLFRRIDELVYALYLIKERGLLQAIDIIMKNNIRAFHPYGFGHTLIVVFEKYEKIPT